jgi:hypothetical protein
VAAKATGKRSPSGWHRNGRSSNRGLDVAHRGLDAAHRGLNIANRGIKNSTRNNVQGRTLLRYVCRVSSQRIRPSFSSQRFRSWNRLSSSAQKVFQPSNAVSSFLVRLICQVRALPVRLVAANGARRAYAAGRTKVVPHRRYPLVEPKLTVLFTIVRRWHRRAVKVRLTEILTGHK